ncbi:MAG: di-trans,poly-cis-decaprenylcistransferase [Elusimicrobia bacterium RIFOXYA2_FULL_39_19]|nr:MAG: di-trans,poly-cis-decaprenylcistransferase [Elusimicrobia bacterium RIFOXYA2_FULL_39_19]
MPEQQDLTNQIDKNRLPVHIAIIMDGNGRWAKKRKLPRLFGHSEGIKTVRTVAQASKDIGIQYLSLYTFSTENWNRPTLEVNGLMRLIQEKLFSEAKDLKKKNVRLIFTGEIEKMPPKVQEEIDRSKKHTQDCTAMTLNLCLNYGSRQEILKAVNNLLELKKESVDEQSFKEQLMTKDIPDPDLLIRTSGEMRISNFLLWQIAYSELFFTDVLWPDFKEADLHKAIIEYQKRDRRFGGI